MKKPILLIQVTLLFLALTDVYSQWYPQLSGTTEHLQGVSFTDANNGMAVGWSGTILRTTNGGTNWTFQFRGTSIYLYDVSFIDANTGTASGRNGTILRTTNGGVTFVNQISSEIPERFSLYQNYPNPFNPSTNIRYTLPKNSFVSLKVYDVLGKEIATLVNESLSPGTYEATFDAAKYSSGIYFYKLTTNDFSDVKKMVLIK